jgi:hypothetical protein
MTLLSSPVVVAAMAKRAGEEPHLNVDKAEASKEIEDLKQRTGM